jgi:tetratricopeptide (TPR) repeat protein
VVVLQHLADLYLYEIDCQKEYLSCIAEIKRCYYLLESWNSATELENRFINNVQHKSIDDVSRIEELEAAVAKAEWLFESTGSKNIQLPYLVLKLQMLHYKFDFSRAEAVAYDYLKVVENNKAVRLKSRLSTAHMNIAYTQFYLNKFTEALEHCKLAAKQGVLTEYNQNINREPQVFALLYLKDYRGALDLVNRMLESGLDGNGHDLMGRRKVLRCYALFLLGEYKQAWLHLQDTREAESDREGWNIGIRLLNILISLSTDKIDLADQRIGALRKHIERTARMRALRKRDMVIFRILSHLSRSGFDFRETWEDRQKDFQQLKSDAQDLRWLPRSHELVIFDQWFESRMLGKPYDPVFPPPRQEDGA